MAQWGEKQELTGGGNVYHEALFRKGIMGNTQQLPATAIGSSAIDTMKQAMTMNKVNPKFPIAVTLQKTPKNKCTFLLGVLTMVKGFTFPTWHQCCFPPAWCAADCDGEEQKNFPGATTVTMTGKKSKVCLGELERKRVIFSASQCSESDPISS